LIDVKSHTSSELYMRMIGNDDVLLCLIGPESTRGLSGPIDLYDK